MVSELKPLSKEDIEKINDARRAVYDLCFMVDIDERTRGALKDLIALPDIFSDKVQGLLDEMDKRLDWLQDERDMRGANEIGESIFIIKKWLGAVIE